MTISFMSSRVFHPFLVAVPCDLTLASSPEPEIHFHPGCRGCLKGKVTQATDGPTTGRSWCGRCYVHTPIV
ncbi:hypothetical protein GGR54DRAFT_553239 [Hypoxylon sp. NC1633]|nr:hypothetical protein GGR54DRAFT_553239 [Hypoxylon sp. NC1633]